VLIVPPQNGGYIATTFSPDGEMIYYVGVMERDQFVPTLYRVPVLGGTPVKVLDHVFSAIGFSRDGNQFAFVRQNPDNTSLMVANTDGSGEPRTLATAKPPNAFSLSGPSWSPDGNRIACGMFNGGGGAGYSSVVEVPATGGEPQPIGAQKWSRVGRVVWLGDGSGLVMTGQMESSSIGTQIWFVPTGGGEPHRITNDLDAYGDVSLGLTSDSHTIATVQQVTTSSIWITAPNEPESRAQQAVKTSLPDTVRWTPDGKIIYAMRSGENWDIWLSNADGSDSKQLTNDAFADQQPSMCGDGRHIVFQSSRARSANIWRMNGDGTELKQLTFGTAVDSYPICSPDGQSVVFFSMRSGEGRGWKVGINGGEPVQITNGNSELPFFSPDGQQIAYFYSDEQANKQRKLGIVPLTGGAPAKTIALPLTVQPIAFAWLPDGKSIAYLDSSSGVLNIWSAPLDGGAAKQLTNFTSGFIDNFAISRDGRIAAYRFNVSRDIVLIKDFR
jgi:Tol biopolymer transport system component